MPEVQAVEDTDRHDGIAQALGKVLNKKSLFGKRESSEMRACAARALGAIKAPEAEAHLQKGVVDRQEGRAWAQARHAAGISGGADSGPALRPVPHRESRSPRAAAN